MTERERRAHDDLLRANEEAERQLLEVVRGLNAAREKYEERLRGR